MADFPSLEIFTDAYLADTADLSLEEHGAYHLMLYVAWRRPDNALPNDMSWLKRALAAHCEKLHGRTFNALIPRLLHRFWVLDPVDNKWHQKRLDKEREFRLKQSRNQSEIALKRWRNGSETVAKHHSETSNSNDLADAAALPAGNAPHPTPPHQKEVSDRTVLNSAREDNQKDLDLGGTGGTVNGHRQHRHRPGSVTIENPDQRLAIFQASLAGALGDDGWKIVNAATDPYHPMFARCIALCRNAARRLNKGWPNNWPSTRKPP